MRSPPRPRLGGFGTVAAGIALGARPHDGKPDPTPKDAADTPYPSARWYQDPAVASSYDADRFDSALGGFVNRIEHLALGRSLEGLPRSSAVLDIACGTGRMTCMLLQRGMRTLGADVSREMMSVARRSVGGSALFRGFVRCDASRLPFKDRSFDAVVGFRFVAHLPDPVRREMLGEAARVSRHTVILSAQSPWCLKHVFRRLWSPHQPGPPMVLSSRFMAREARRYGLRARATTRALPLIAETYVIRLEH